MSELTSCCPSCGPAEAGSGPGRPETLGTSLRQLPVLCTNGLEGMLLNRALALRNVRAGSFGSHRTLYSDSDRSLESWGPTC